MAVTCVVIFSIWSTDKTAPAFPPPIVNVFWVVSAVAVTLAPAAGASPYIAFILFKSSVMEA